MTISAAQFEHWIKSDASGYVVLLHVDFKWETTFPEVATTGTIYLSTRPYSTQPTDTPASTPHWSVIQSGPTFARAISLEELGGAGRFSVGSVSLDNHDDRLSFLFDVVLDGSAVRAYVGDVSWPFSDFREVGTALSVNVEESNKVITLNLRSDIFGLDREIQGGAIASGPNTGRPKPVCIGSVLNLDVMPFLLDTAGPTYYFNSYAQYDFEVVVDVRDNGLTLAGAGFSGTNAAITAVAGTDTITRAAHGLIVNDVVIMMDVDPFPGLLKGVQYWVIAAGLTANDFRLSLTRGGAAADITGTTFSGTLRFLQRRWYVDASAATIMLSSAPAGRVTCDLQAKPAAGAYSYYPHTAMRWLLDTYTDFTSSNRDEAALTAREVHQAANFIYWGKAIMDRTNAKVVLDEIAASTNSWYGPMADGSLGFGLLGLPTLDGETATETITDFLEEPKFRNLPVSFGQTAANVSRNVAVQTDGIAAAVTAANRSLYGSQYRYRFSSAIAVDSEEPYISYWSTLYHQTALHEAPRDTCLVYDGSNPGGIQGLVDDRRELFRPWTKVLSGRVSIDYRDLEVGECVSVEYDRWGLDDGKNFRVISVEPHIVERYVELVLVRQDQPDYLTSSYN